MGPNPKALKQSVLECNAPFMKYHSGYQVVGMACSNQKQLAYNLIRHGQKIYIKQDSNMKQHTALKNINFPKKTYLEKKLDLEG